MTDGEKHNTNMPNAGKISKLHQLLDSSLVRVMRRGYYGTVTITVVVEDGILQGADDDIKQKHRLK